MTEQEFSPKTVDMSDEMVDFAKLKIKEALTDPKNEREAAKHIKKEFDKKYEPYWHCVVGKSFGANGTHETKHFLYIYYGPWAVQLWKCG